MALRKILAAMAVSACLLWPMSAGATTITGIVPAPSRDTVETLFYGRGVMERTYANHQNPRFDRTGDYVPTLRPRHDANCLTAVNYRSRWMLHKSMVIVVELWDRVEQRWERFNCAAADWQQARHSTGSRQRLEVDWNTAVAVNMTRSGTTRARIIGYR